MSAEDPVIPVSTESSEPERVDSSAIPPSEPLVVKDVPNVDFSSAVPMTEPPAETAQTASDDTHPVPLKHDTNNIPNPTPTNPNGSANGAETTTLVNEPDNTVEIGKADDDVEEDKVPIKREVNGDVEGAAFGGSDGADLDLADQTLVEEASRDVDASVIQEIADVPVKVLDDEKKIVVEEEEHDVPEPVAVPVKDVEDAVSADIPAPEVVESVVLVEEETSAIDEPEPEVNSKPPIVETAEVDADPRDLEPVVNLCEDEPAPSEEPLVEEPVIEDLEEAKKVEEYAAEIEVAPVVIGSRVEDDHTEEPPAEAAEVPPIAVNGHGHSDEGSTGEQALGDAVAEEPTSNAADTPVPGDAEPMAEEPSTVEGDTEPRTESEEVPPAHDDDVLPEVQDAPAATGVAELDPAEEVDIVEPEPVKEVEVTESENTQEALPVDEPSVPEPVLEPSNDVKEVPVEAEPVVARPLTVFAVPEPLVVVEEAQVVDSVDEAEVPVPLAEEAEGPGPIVAESAEEPEPSPEDTAPEPTAELETVVTEVPDVPAEPVVREAPPVEPESVAEPQKTEAADLPVPSEEPAVDDVELEEVTPAISEPIEAEPEVPISDVPREETKSVERPWTPSYSVSSQGGGLDKVAPADEEVPEPTIVPEPPVEESAAPAPEIVTPTEEPVVAEPEITADNVQETSSWTPSYSTTAQGSSPRFESQVTLESYPEPIPAVSEDVPTVTQEGEPELAATESAAEDLTQVVSHSEEPATVEPEATPGEVSETASWTPSYSTTVQGSSPRFESEAISEDNSEPTSSGPLPSDDVPVTTPDAEFVQAPAETETAVEISEPTVTEDEISTTDVPAIDAPSEEPPSDHANLVQSEGETERPKSPWTPSYSVTTLPGSGSSPHVDSNVDETPAAEVEAETSPAKVEGTETPKIITPEDEKDEEPVDPTAITESPSWTQSYSVTSQPGSPRVSPKAELKELEPELQPLDSVQEPPLVAPIVELADVPETVVTPAAEDEGVAEPVPEEESKPAWTQSYSVTSQPGSPRISPKQVSEEVPEEEEEVKPSWTQSYSVTSQPGSPRVSPKEDLHEPIVEPLAVADEPTTVVTPPVEETTPAPDEGETAERPKSPWTPSYSVTTLEGQAERAHPEDTEPEPEVVAIPKSFSEEPSEVIHAPHTGALPSEPLAVDDGQPERPKSPWTPSYSVTTLPGSAPAEQPEPDSVTGDLSVDVEASVPETVKTVEDQPKENGTTTDVFEVHEAVFQLAVHEEAEADVEGPEPAHPQLDLPKPDVAIEVEEKPSWTPSYSVTHLSGASPKAETKEEPQASRDVPTIDEVAAKKVESTTETAKEDEPHYFPRVPESLDEAPEKPKLDLLISSDPQNISKISPRGRYESSTSSRLFPGGWFSSPKSPGDEGRTSMEEATGEFVLSRPSMAPNEPAVAEAPEDVPASPITPASPTTKKDKKWRMCEIM